MYKLDWSNTFMVQAKLLLMHDYLQNTLWHGSCDYGCMTVYKRLAHWLLFT